MSKKDQEQIVVAMFDSETAANNAVDAMQNWEKANDDVKLGSIATWPVQATYAATGDWAGMKAAYEAGK